MINFLNVSKVYPGPGGAPKVVLNRASLRIDAGERVGILAPPGSGKTTIARLIAGTVLPTGGNITKEGQVSWPLGYASGLHPVLSPAENVSLIARLYNEDPADLALRVAYFADIGKAFAMPMAQLPPADRVRVAMGLSLSIDFDMYLADEFSAVGTPGFQDKVEAALEVRLAAAGLILLTRHPRLVDRFTDRTFVLTRGKLVECTSTEEAKLILELTAHEKPEPRHAAA